VARIIAAVMGDSLGHLNQMLAVADGMPEHEFLFVGGGTVTDLRSSKYAVCEIPFAGTLYADNSMDVVATVCNALKVYCGAPHIARRVAGIIKEFDPLLILTSWEYFVPLVARHMGRYCVSIDNQHFITKCRYDAPKGERLSRFLFWLSVRLRHFVADRFLVNSFFPVEPIDASMTDVFPPLIAPKVREVTPAEGDYVLVYQTTPTFERLFPVLEEMRREFIIYGFGHRPQRKNLEFRAPCRERFVEEMANCSYVITNGGHTAISEALYFGKPVFSFPIHMAYEQLFNAYSLAALGYGEYSKEKDPSGTVLKDFEARADTYRAKIKGGDFCGNARVIARVQGIMRECEAGKASVRTNSRG